MAVVLFSTVATGAKLVTGQIFNLCASEPEYILRGGGGGGVLLYFHTYVGSGHFLGVQHFEFQYFFVFRKN